MIDRRDMMKGAAAGGALLAASGASAQERVVSSPSGGLKARYAFSVSVFFKERVTEWVEPKMPWMLGAALLISVIGVLYLGIFAGGVIEKFSQPRATYGAQIK